MIIDRKKLGQVDFWYLKYVKNRHTDQKTLFPRGDDATPRQVQRVHVTEMHGSNHTLWEDYIKTLQRLPKQEMIT